MEPYYSLTYPLPQSSRWALNFADAVHYLAAHRGQPVRITARACITLMNGAPVLPGRYETLRHRFMESWKQAVNDGWLVECTPNTHKAEKKNTGSLRLGYRNPRRVYCFLAPQLHQFETGNAIRKPLGYVENGWLNALNSIYSRRLLNFLLHLSPPANGHRPGLAEALRQFTGNSSPALHPGRVQDAIDELAQHELVIAQGDAWRVNWPRFRQMPWRPSQLQYTGQPVFEADWLTARAIDLPRAQQARQVMEQGGWSPLLFWRIFTDLAATSAQQRQNLMQYTARLSPSGLARHRQEWRIFLQQAAS
ncbi:MAG: hypothetical protein Kow0031_11600 [Anaerolineae bacterium]